MQIQRRALLVGIDHYEMMEDLNWCVDDVFALRHVLEVHENREPNFSCRTLLGTGPSVNPQLPEQRVNLNRLRSELEELFDFDGMVLFYFSGHGYQTENSVYLVTQDGNPKLPGLSLKTLLKMANESRAQEVLLIIDSCFSGALGEPGTAEVQEMENFYLRSGVTLLAASQANQKAREMDGSGMFTHLVIAALKGGASDIRGHISAASIYGYVEQALGPWDQRPIYKSNARQLSPIRYVAPDIKDEDLRYLPSLFPTQDHHYSLDPTYEVTRSESNPEHIAIFSLFKRYQIARLLRPSVDQDLYFAALASRPVELTPLGQFYWQLAKSDLLGNAPTSQTTRRKAMPEPESVARLFHEAYERLAPQFGYETREETRVDWADVPSNNKHLMIAVAGEVLAMLYAPEEMP
jgi:hypothetical protein